MDIKLAIKKFNDAINSFYTARLIIVERNIGRLLELIASTPELYGVIAECAKSANYQAEYKKAVSRDGVGGYFNLPANRRQLISLITGLLYEFDNKTLSIVDFVTGYFPGETSHESYLTFCEKVITPYAEAFRYMLEGEPGEISGVLSEELSIIPFPDKAKEDADFWLRSLLDIIVGDNSISESERREIVTMIKGLLYVLDTRNPMLIKIVWIGLKNTVGGRKVGFREMKETEMVLMSYGVID